VRFVRQVVVSRYIVDFLAPAARLVVDVDGVCHAQPGRLAADRRRDETLVRLGYRVLRLPVWLVEHRPAQAVALVREALPV